MDVQRAARAGKVANIALYCWMAAELSLIFINADYLAGAGVNVWIATPRVVALGASITALTLVPTALLFLIWVYRAMIVAHQITPDLKITPGWSVGWFFVPIASLWKPYETMSEIAEGSGANAIQGTPALIGWWWAAWLARGVCGAFTWVSRGNGQLTERMLISVIISSIFGIAAALLLQTIIQRVGRVQTSAVDASIFA